MYNICADVLTHGNPIYDCLIRLLVVLVKNEVSALCASVDGRRDIRIVAPLVDVLREDVNIRDHLMDEGAAAVRYLLRRIEERL